MADEDISKELATKEREGPKVVVFLSGDSDLTGVFVAADTVYTEVNVKGGVMGGVMVLLAMYYIFDLAYPRAFHNILGMFQIFVMDEPFKHNTSKGFKLLCKDLRKELCNM